jgi:Flp pilus assembly protein TadG
MRRLLRASDGQSTVEILGMLPLLIVVVLAAAELLAAGAARSSASSAAEAAAMAVLQGGDPSAAARAAAPGWTHPHITVRSSGRHVRVRLTPPSLLPGLTNLLSTTAEADAGPAAEAGVAARRFVAAVSLTTGPAAAAAAPAGRAS